MSIPVVFAGGVRPQILADTQKQSARERSRREAALNQLAGSLPGKSSRENREAALARLRKLSRAFNRRLQFVVNHESNEVLVKVIDGATDKVIKILPPEELQRLRHDGAHEAVGALLNEQV